MTWGLVPKPLKDEAGSYQKVVGEVPKGRFWKGSKPLETRGESREDSFAFPCSSVKSPACKADPGLWISNGVLIPSFKMSFCFCVILLSSAAGRRGEGTFRSDGWRRRFEISPLLVLRYSSCSCTRTPLATLPHVRLPIRRPTERGLRVRMSFFP